MWTDAASAPVSSGEAFPLGATCRDGGVNFSVFSRDAERVELLLYRGVDDAEPQRVIALDGAGHRTDHYRHVFVPGLDAGQLYAWRAHGPFEPARGWRFDGDKVLLDPYGRAVAVPSAYDRRRACRPGRNDAHAFKSAVADLERYDWEGDRPLRRPVAGTIVYEMHVRGFTAHPNSGLPAGRRGTYAGLVEKIPYLVDLGVTAVELMPVFQFDPQDAPQGLVNYWGYSPVSLFAPHAGYSSRPDPLAVLDEFRDMVKALHRAGIEVILDVVYNHTAEGNEHGPTLGLRGLDNRTYYMLESGGGYANYSGCGNTLNANRAVVRRMIVDSLQFWVRHMHVDGFRFDLAAILSRDEEGRPLASPPVLWDIDSDPLLAGTKLIAEAWDAAGLYQVGGFVGDRWKEWNGQFRDDVRAFVRGDSGMVPRLAKRLLGSPDLYGDRAREPERSVNFVTCHDGFTMEDLVSHNERHNEANLEGNRDGSAHNLSWNCGHEGPTTDPAVLALRRRQVRNLLTIELLSVGLPMLLMGDEVRRSQGGNNNAWCQDNETSWFDWSAVERHADLRRFVRRLIRLRLRRPSMPVPDRLTLEAVAERAGFAFHGVELNAADHSWVSHSLALTARTLDGDVLMYIALNAWWHPLDFRLPALPAWATSGWRAVIDTARASPRDIVAVNKALPVAGGVCRVEARSIVVLFAFAWRERA